VSLSMVKGPNLCVFFDALVSRRLTPFVFVREDSTVVRRLKVVGVTTVNQHHDVAEDGCWFIQLRGEDGRYYYGTYNQNTCRGHWTEALGPPSGGREL
jgi:hypothetical protein